MTRNGQSKHMGILSWVPSGQSSIRSLNSDVGGKGVTHRDGMVVPMKCSQFDLRSHNNTSHLLQPLFELISSCNKSVSIPTKGTNLEVQVETYSEGRFYVCFSCGPGPGTAAHESPSSWSRKCVKLCEEYPRQSNNFCTCTSM